MNAKDVKATHHTGRTRHPPYFILRQYRGVENKGSRLRLTEHLECFLYVTLIEASIISVAAQMERGRYQPFRAWEDQCRNLICEVSSLLISNEPCNKKE